MTLAEAVAARQIEEIVHFTTNHGCLGTIYTRLLQSRQRLHTDEMVKYLFAPNAIFRKDAAYIDYVSLSVEHINHTFYETSSASWHRSEPIFWCILAFDPMIVTHPGVEFATTNNIYSGVLRGVGLQGFDAIFAHQIVRWAGNSAARGLNLPSSYPTCYQAEVLYPHAVSTEHLLRIYVRSQKDQSEVVGFLKATFHRDVDVVVDAQKFGNRPL